MASYGHGFLEIACLQCVCMYVSNPRPLTLHMKLIGSYKLYTNEILSFLATIVETIAKPL